MKDTSPAMEARYRAMLLSRSGEQRLRMADSMYATARRLVVVSILAEHPDATPAELRCAVFLRFYGHEFDPGTRARIVACLGTEPVSLHRAAPTLTRRRAPERAEVFGTRLRRARVRYRRRRWRMTVAELVERLSALPPDLQVIVEGCDCVGDAVDVAIRNDFALIMRADGVYSAVARRTPRS